MRTPESKYTSFTDLVIEMRKNNFRNYQIAKKLGIPDYAVRNILWKSGQGIFRERGDTGKICLENKKRGRAHNFKDISGQKFNHLTVIRIHQLRIIGQKVKKKKIYWLCECDCGNTCVSGTSHLTGGYRVSCGCMRGKTLAGPKTENFQSVWNSHWARYKASARIRKIDILISKEEFISTCSQSCHYCGSLPKETKYTGKFGKIRANGIDRKDNNKGYINGNCLPCCGTCNFMRSNLTYAAFIEQIKKICLNKILKL